MIYLIVFALSIAATYAAQRFVKEKLLFGLFSAVAVLLPSVLAGCRDSGIGTDTLIYADRIWENIVACGDWETFFLMLSLGLLGEGEVGYLLINFMTSLFSDDLHAIYFTPNFLVVLLFYLTAYDNRNRASMWLMMTLFFFLYYNLSLNLIRQSIAMALTVYTFKYLEQRRWKKYIGWQFVVLMFHNTAFLNLLLVPLFHIPRIKHVRNRQKWMWMASVGILLGFFFLDKILGMVVSTGILPEKFLMYAAEDSESVVNLTESVKNVGLLFILILAGSKLKGGNVGKEARTYVFMKFASVLFFMSSVVSQHAARIAYYITPLTDCFFIPRALFLLRQRDPLLYKQLLACLILLSIAFWYWLIVVRGNTETYPYTSRVLGIS